MMIADRLEKRLGNGYSVEAHVNPHVKTSHGYEGTEMSGYNDIELQIFSNDGALSLDDVAFICKTAHKLLWNMMSEAYVSDFGYGNITITVEHLRNIDYPRRNMIPKRSRKYQDIYDRRGKDTGYANSNFTRPQSWSETEN